MTEQDRQAAIMNILHSTMLLQEHVSFILEAKAREAEKARIWVCNHVHPAAFEDADKHFAAPMQVHTALVEVIEGLTKLESALNANMKAALNKDESADSGGFPMFGGDSMLGMEDEDETGGEGNV